MRELEPLIREGWPTAAACLLGAIAMLAGLRSALHRTELALRDKLAVVLAAGALATAGIAPQLVDPRTDALTRATGLAAEHPLAITGALVALSLAIVATALAWWVRYWVRTLLRLVMLAAFVAMTLAWCIARFVLAQWLDGWTGAHLGTSGWNAILDGAGVAAIVLSVAFLLRARAPRAHAA